MGEIFNKLPNKEELEDYIRTYAGDGTVSGDREPAPLSHLMRYWEKNKGEYLYELLGKEYIIEKTYTFKKDVQDIINEVRHSCRYGIMREFYDNYCDYISTRYQNQERIDENDEHPWDEYKALSRLVEFEALGKSVVNFWSNNEKSVKVRVNEEGTIIAIQDGAKPIRLLAKFAQAWGIEGFEAFRLELSRILNDKFLTGTMCLSIHPLDYITMSDNPYDWESCMNWMDGGQYRMGTVEMMNSQYVVVAYIKGEKPLRFYDHIWNGKKWRNLYIVDHDFITGIKGYPYQNSNMDEFCVNWIKELAEKNLDWHYEDEVISYSPDSSDDCVYSHSLNQYINYTFETGVMYNDFGNSNHTHMVLRKGFDRNSIYCYYSGETECMYCGNVLDNSQDENGDLDDCGNVICNSCARSVHCDCCGDSFSDYSNLYELDGEYFCENCYEEYAIQDIDGETHNMNNCKKVLLLNRKLEDGEVLDPDRTKSVWVYNDYDLLLLLKNNERINHHVYKKEDWYWNNSFNYITPEQLNDDGVKFFKSNFYLFSDPDNCRYLWWWKSAELKNLKNNYIIYM